MKIDSVASRIPRSSLATSFVSSASMLAARLFTKFIFNSFAANSSIRKRARFVTCCMYLSNGLTNVKKWANTLTFAHKHTRDTPNNIFAHTHVAALVVQKKTHFRWKIVDEIVTHTQVHTHTNTRFTKKTHQLTNRRTPVSLFSSIVGLSGQKSAVAYFIFHFQSTEFSVGRHRLIRACSMRDFTTPVHVTKHQIVILYSFF